MIFFSHAIVTVVAYSLSLLDALPIYPAKHLPEIPTTSMIGSLPIHKPIPQPDRKSTRLNSSHVAISYAVFCLKKKKSSQLSRSRTSTERWREHTPQLQARVDFMSRRH